MTSKELVATLATAVLLSATSAAAAQSGGVKRIIPEGQDGDYTFFAVTCTSKQRVSVVVDQTIARVCAQRRDAKPRCEKDWPIEQAAAYACASPGRG